MSGPAAADKRVIACNVAQASGVFATGARAYVRYTVGDDRLSVLGRSRGGRWVGIWQALERLENFRVVTLPPAHPLYHYELHEHDVDRLAARLSDVARRLRWDPRA